LNFMLVPYAPVSTCRAVRAPVTWITDVKARLRNYHRRTQHRELKMIKLFAVETDTLLLSMSAVYAGVIAGVLLFALFTH